MVNLTCAILAGLALMTGAAEAEPQPVDGQLLPIEQNIIMYTNYERTKYGLKPLEVDWELMKPAQLPKTSPWANRTAARRSARG
jgi:hypothetical protein